MTAFFGPQALPYPQPTDLPDGPGAFLALIQAVTVGGAQPFPSYAALTAAGAPDFPGQLAIVNGDATAWRNGIYQSNGAAWSLITGPRFSPTVTPGTNYSLGTNAVTQRGTSVTCNIVLQKSSALVVNEVAGTLPAGSRPPVTLPPVIAASTAGGSGFVIVTIGSDGTIKPTFISNAAATNISLDVEFENS